MPVNGAIQIAFDRYLLPSTVNRQSIGILDSSNNALPAPLAPIVEYDPIARTVTLSRPAAQWLTEGQTYTLVLGIPEAGADVGGVRAIDGATIGRDQKREYAFLVGPAAPAPPEASATLCRDVLPMFIAKCSEPTCHGSGTRAAASLILDTSAGIAATAFNRIAQGSNTGPRSSEPPAAGQQFGVDMPIIDPGNPGNSWLMYKVELAPLPVARQEAPPKIVCATGLLEKGDPFVFAPLVPGAHRGADDYERSALASFILGREMPFPTVNGAGYSVEPLTLDERQQVRLWIKSLVPGQPPASCGGCAFPNVPADAGPRDAGTD